MVAVQLALLLSLLGQRRQSQCSLAVAKCYHNPTGKISTAAGTSAADCCAHCGNTSTCTSFTYWRIPGDAAYSCRLYSTIGTLVSCDTAGDQSGWIGPPAPSPPPPAPPPPPTPPAPKNAKNVLFIGIDDLRPQLGAYGPCETNNPPLNNQESARGH